MEVSHNLPDNIHHRWNQHGIHHPYEFDHYSTPHSWYDPRNSYTGYPGCSPILSNIRDAVRAQSGRAIISDDGFLVSLDVHQFVPKELTVKTVGNSIVVEAKHEERPDEHGYVSRQFSRRYDLPKGFHPDYVVPELSSDGILTIKATPEHKISKGERILQLQHTGPARLYVMGKDKVAQDKVVKDTDGVKEKPKKQDELLTK